ncbi:Threonine/homoserine/homoserine lactone efflux protein [Methylobacterium sp. 174MFSha1.1]|uniref:LysE family translocator n=1 Tax=Methylobacterium sp. 174MFSha1.1 TaxID=1502749 RepID=UPI0008F231A5|nr:LysE family translocator [Methylobacterium sp. 174MFSha1.1]SFU98941.1 Threonine/homoserine/homoserine lactone efflux protein [Methylobacterium sp. 174MFSha1.1]
MDWTWFLSAGAFAVAMSATPGPNNTMVVASGATYGFARTVPHMLGIAAGFPVMLVVLGTAGLPLLTDPRVHAVLKWAGAAYLLWLAWKIASSDSDPADPATTASRPLGFLQAALFQWVNPKAWIIAAGALATYTAQAEAAPLAATLALAILFGLVALPCLGFWTLIGVGTARVLRTRRALRVFNLAMAGLLVASLVPTLRD